MGQPQHLSIGEVLALVQQDFPDVTISKIRFLESQGLLDPERTPSGYRKFYGPDIERLQWILTQQRDNFLPLRVIRERLDEWDATGVSPAPDRPSAEEHGMYEGDDQEGTSGGAAAPDAVSRDTSRPDDVDLRSAAEALAAASADEVAAFRAEQAARQQPVADPEPGPVSGEASTGEPADGEVVEDGADFEVGPEDTAMTAEELAERCGVAVGVIKELESFSMISSHRVGPEHYYEPDCLRVVHAVRPFLERGIEVRHLRMYKIAAEREAGVFEQLVMPLLKQRNPEARARAVAQVQALAEAGEQLHSALLRQALRQTLP